MHTDERSTPAVGLERRGHVALLTLDDVRRRNAMSPELGDALERRVEELRAAGDVRAVVLTGAGGAFSGGGDLAMLERLRTVGEDEAKTFMLGFYRRYLSILDIGCPVVAAVVGPAIGAGLAVALACHMMVVAEDAKLALNFASLGLFPGMGATFTAPLRVGAQRASELLMTGRRIDGAEAARMGMALSAHPPGEVLERALELATAVAAQGPIATRRLAAVLGPEREGLSRALLAEATHQAESYQSEDLRIGLEAAKLRTAPQFVGR